MMKWKRIYICSPLRADSYPDMLRNMNRAQHYIEITAGRHKCRAVAPHAYMPFILDDNEPDERALALDFGKKLLELCDVLIVCGDVISDGMRGEILYAAQLGLPIRTLNHSSKMEASIQAVIEEMN